MAGRTSKYQIIQKQKETLSQKWNVAIYIRLSQEDDDNDSKKQESNSITSQKALLQEFIEEQQDLTLYDIYIDDGYTGTDFERPGFQRLLNDMKIGAISCIIVKDLSRLGRNYIEVGNYMEQVFPLFNIRFIAVNDHIDSYLNPESNNTILVPFKNLINDEYARDTSIKIKSSLKGRKKRGEFVGAFPSYGYRKDPKDKHKLIVDPVAADIVKRIFDWNVRDGIGKMGIAHRLNEQGVLNPTGHKKIELQENYENNTTIGEDYTWTPSTIRKILQNEIYIGNTVQGKRRVKSYKIHQVEEVPKEEWIRVENTHEAIIPREIFEKAQEIGRRDTRSSPKTKELSMWAGMLICKDCKRAMHRKTSKNAYGKVYEYYICSTYHKRSKTLCTPHKIRVKDLEEAVLETIQIQIKSFVEVEKLLQELEGIKIENHTNTLLEEGIQKKQKEIEKNSRIKLMLYEDWKNEDITREEFIQYKKKYEKDLEKLQGQKEKMKQEIEEKNDPKILQKGWIKNFQENKNITILTRAILLQLVDSITIGEGGKMIITFNFKNPSKK